MDIIYITLQNLERRYFKIKVNKNETIGEAKRKYNISGQWKFGSAVLNDDKTFEHYYIEDDDNITYNNTSQGGGFFGVETIDISKNYGTNNIDSSSSAPFYRLIESGLNIQSICKTNNKNCIANEKTIYIPIGFVKNWNLLDHLNQVKCPECKEIVKPLNFGFLNCKYEIEYEKLENDEYNDGKVKGRTDWDEFIIFDQYYSGKAFFKKLIFNITNLFP